LNNYKKVSAKANEHINKLSQDTGWEIDNETFCILPFVHISTMPQGEVKLCCRGQPPKNIVDGYDTYNGNPHVQNGNFDLEEYWNSDYLNKVRQDLIDGVKIPQCKNCWKMEDQEILSLRQNRLIDHGAKPKYMKNVTEWIETGRVPFNIPIMELKLSNICNFKCRMCWPKDSSAWAQDWDRVEQFYDQETREYVHQVHDIAGGKRLYNMFETNNNFVDKLITLLDNVEEIEFAGGEPILDPIHYRVLNNVKHPERVVLKYATNLSTLLLNDKHNILELWKKFKGVKLTISIDGYDSLNTYIRRGSDWALLKENIAKVREAIGDNIVQIKGTTCISAFNALELDKTAEAIIMELGIQWHTSRLQYPEFQHANVLPTQQLKESILKLQETKKLIEVQPGYQKFNLLHIDGAINWLEYCIDNSNHTPDTYTRFNNFNKTLDT